MKKLFTVNCLLITTLAGLVAVNSYAMTMPASTEQVYITNFGNNSVSICNSSMTSCIAKSGAGTLNIPNGIAFSQATMFKHIC